MYKIKCEDCGIVRELQRKPKTNLCRSCSGKNRPSKHGMYKTRLYTIWNSAKKRTSGSLNSVSRRYTERGILMCKQWREDFTIFREWALNNGYSDKLTLDRIDTNGHYEPSNCRWTTKLIQSQNTILLHKTNKTGYRGVSKYSYNFKDGRVMYRARVKYMGKEINLGKYDTAKEAAKAYNNYVSANLPEIPLNIIKE